LSLNTGLSGNGLLFDLGVSFIAIDLEPEFKSTSSLLFCFMEAPYLLLLLIRKEDKCVGVTLLLICERVIKKQLSRQFKDKM
jgi:hypothetical protein